MVLTENVFKKVHFAVLARKCVFAVLTENVFLGFDRKIFFTILMGNCVFAALGGNAFSILMEKFIFAV